jgi:hypothetical protein
MDLLENPVTLPWKKAENQAFATEKPKISVRKPF